MNSEEGQKSLESMVAQMLAAKLKQIGVAEAVANQTAGSLDFDEIRKYLALTDEDFKATFAKLL